MKINKIKHLDPLPIFVETRKGCVMEMNMELFVKADEMRVNELNLLIESLAAFDSKTGTREDFTSLFQQAVRSLELNEDYLADLLETTRTTINRWENGKNVPSRSLRKPVFNAIAKDARMEYVDLRFTPTELAMIVTALGRQSFEMYHEQSLYTELFNLRNEEHIPGYDGAL